MAQTATTTDAARAVEQLRLAEARLARRRQTECGPSETARAAMRYVYESSDAGLDVTPTMVAEHVGVSTASMTTILDRLRTGGLIVFERNPDDGRSKFVRPLDRSADPDDFDPLTAQVRRLASKLSGETVAEVVHFLELITDAVDRECT
ncbi:MarR family winged helix-turn-helix transcriptional regulator [Microbacterium aureliae]